MILEANQLTNIRVAFSSSLSKVGARWNQRFIRNDKLDLALNWLFWVVLVTGGMVLLILRLIAQDQP